MAAKTSPEQLRPGDGRGKPRRLLGGKVGKGEGRALGTAVSQAKKGKQINAVVIFIN